MACISNVAIFGIALCVTVMMATSKGCSDANCCNPICMVNSNTVCCKEHEGRMRFQARKKLLEICDGHNWLEVQLQASHGSKENPGLSCKDILSKKKIKKNSSPNGVYWIRFTGKVMPVYCDMKTDGGGWTMVFKTVAGTRLGRPGPGVMWEDPKTYNEHRLSVLDVTSKSKLLYKNSIALGSNWPKFPQRQARVVLYTRGRSVKNLKFNSRGTTSKNWFSLQKFDKRSSPWTDLARANKVQFFDIHKKNACHAKKIPRCRTFFINKSYGGCPRDFGWLVLGGRACAWEKKRRHVPAILYSKGRTVTNWNTRGAVGEAEVMAVFVR